jgi:hypothetical protein
MPEKSYSGIVSFTVSLPWQSGIGIPASTSVRYRWSRIGPVVPTYALRPIVHSLKLGKMSINWLGRSKEDVRRDMALGF